ncbi:MAG: thioredoxin domain-containing protein [Pseudohongiellaceae bacterium]
MSNKREQQRLAKEQKQQAAERKDATMKLLGKVALFGVLPVFILLVIFTFVSQGPTYSPIEIADNDHVRGDAASPVIMTMYADFQCPACAQEFALITRAWPQLRDKTKLVFRHYPLTDMHAYAWTAALYAEAAARQEKFWEMHDLLFVNQSYWSTLTTNEVELEFDMYASQLGLDLEQLHADMTTDEVIQKLRSDQRGGNLAGVRSTPTLFINGNLVVVNSMTRLIELVNQAAGG